MDQTSATRPAAASSSVIDRPWLQRFAALTALFTLVVIGAGGVVTTIGAGLSVPDWPTSYERLVGPDWLGPERWYREPNVRAEHGHRLLGATLGCLVLALAIWVHVVQERRWVRHLAKALFVAVCFQGLLGGITVKNFLPVEISTLHGCFAQAIFCGAMTIAVGLSRTWSSPLDRRGAAAGGGGTRALALALVVLVFVQLLLGALMRHMKDPLEPVNPLAIRDFPLMMGGLVPPLEDVHVVLHFLHRTGALLILIGVFALGIRVARRHGGLRTLTRPVALLCALVLVQVGLGAAVIWTGKEAIPTVAHVATGATVLATAWVVFLFVWRATARIAPAPSVARARVVTLEARA